ncbi:hypothetical protein SLS58_009654 [Diplodia intermedia]|uniref:Uncharacterized protein n=1 Tax=Diplodia intermedia TaxID=856260 RepID=A0ABR3TB61_9PEZI
MHFRRAYIRSNRDNAARDPLVRICIQDYLNTRFTSHDINPFAIMGELDVYNANMSDSTLLEVEELVEEEAVHKLSWLLAQKLNTPARFDIAMRQLAEAGEFFHGFGRQQNLDELAPAGQQPNLGGLGPMDKQRSVNRIELPDQQLNLNGLEPVNQQSNPNGPMSVNAPSTMAPPPPPPQSRSHHDTHDSSHHDAQPGSQPTVSSASDPVTTTEPIKRSSHGKKSHHQDKRPEHATNTEQNKPVGKKTEHATKTDPATNTEQKKSVGKETEHATKTDPATNTEQKKPIVRNSLRSRIRFFMSKKNDVASLSREEAKLVFEAPKYLFAWRNLHFAVDLFDGKPRLQQVEEEIEEMYRTTDQLAASVAWTQFWDKLVDHQYNFRELLHLKQKADGKQQCSSQTPSTSTADDAPTKVENEQAVKVGKSDNDLSLFVGPDAPVSPVMGDSNTEMKEVDFTSILADIDRVSTRKSGDYDEAFH